MLPVHLYTLNADRLRFLWDKFNTNLDMFGDEFPRDMAGFLCWVSNETSLLLTVGDPEEPSGLFIFTDMVPGDSAITHIYIWDKEKYTPQELYETARATLRIVMLRMSLRRVAALIPTWKPEVKVFARQVGMKMEGTMRDATLRDGEPADLWLMAITARDLGDTIKEGGQSEQDIEKEE